jgi:hypothetical protein
MFSIHIHPHTETHIPTEMHTGSAGEHSTSGHAPTPHAPASASSTLAFSAAGESGLHSGLLSHLGNKPSTFNPTSVKLPGDTNSYVIKDASNTRTPQPLYAESDIGSLKQTSKLGIYDGNGGVKLDNGLPGGVKVLSNERSHDAFQAFINSYNPNAGASSSSTRGNTYSPSPAGSHSFSERGAWNNPSTASSNAPPRPPKSSSVSSKTSSIAPPLAPRNTTSFSAPAHPFHSTMGPKPDSRYLKDSGDAQSKYWFIPDGHGGSKPADSSIDKYGQPVHIFMNGPRERYGKGEWTGPNHSVLPPPPQKDTKQVVS